MSYITQTDIEDIFGTTNVAKWSQRSQASTSTTADTARIADAITYAEDVVNSRFRHVSRYTIPFVATGSAMDQSVVYWCAALAGVWLFNARGATTDKNADGDGIRSHRAIAMAEMDAVLAGMRRLACQTDPGTGTGRATAPVGVA